jgi:hypothetical protein
MPDWYLLTGDASAEWLKLANSTINQSKFLGGSEYKWSKTTDPQIIMLKAGKPRSIAVLVTDVQNVWNSRFTVDVLWTRSSIKQSQSTGQRQVAHQVPYQFQEQRTVYQVKQVPFWEIIFAPN